MAIGVRYGGNDRKKTKEALLAWVASKIPQIPLNNFTTDWNDGRAITALVNAVKPGLVPDGHLVDPNIKANEKAKKAIDAAKKCLKVPAVSKLLIVWPKTCRAIIDFELYASTVFFFSAVGVRDLRKLNTSLPHNTTLLRYNTTV